MARIYYRGYRFYGLITSTIFVVWLSFRIAVAQTQEYAFGEICEFQIPSKFESATLLQWNVTAPPFFALWSSNGDTILFSKFNKKLESIQYYTKQITEKYDKIYSADLNKDGNTDLILLNKSEKKIAVVLDIESELLEAREIIKLDFEPDEIVFCDYNNDTNLDILVYSRKVPGVLPLQNNGKSRFQIKKTIAPDNSIGALTPAFVNNDNLIDLFLYDWVKSELHVLYGVGKGRFIDQSVFPVKGDVEEIKATSFSRHRKIDLLLKLSNNTDFQIWSGDYFGDFKLTRTVALKSEINDYGVVDVNNDRLNDIVALTTLNSIKIIFNDYADPFSNRIALATTDYSSKIFFSDDYSAKECITINNKLNQFYIYKNALIAKSMIDTAVIASGLNPTEIISEDFNCDGIADFAVLCTKSQSIFLYYGRKEQIPFGPFSHSLNAEPKYLSFHSKSDSSVRFVLSYPNSNQLSFLSIDTADNSISNAFIGCAGSSEALSASIKENYLAEFITFNESITEGNSISFFDQINAFTFLERTFRLPSSNSLLGASVIDLNSDKFPDIVYAYRYGDTSVVELGVAFGDSNFVMKNRIVSKDLALPNVNKIFMFSHDFNKDGIMDLLIQADAPATILMITWGISEGQYSDPKIISSGIIVEERSNIKIVDVDKDGLTDIVIGSQKNKQIIWFRNIDNFMFDNQHVLASHVDFSHYAIADIDCDNINDLVLTFSNKGIVKIIDGNKLSYKVRKK